MFLLLINLCILPLLVPCICHNQNVLIRPPRNTEKDRVLSGYNCSTIDHPYVVKINAIYESGPDQHCTGTLLTPYHVLTAAHCCEYPDQFAVVGANSPNRAERYVMAMYVHPNFIYKKFKPRADVCIMRLESAVKYSRYITQVRLPPKALSVHDFDKLCENKQGLILGWGWPWEPAEDEWDYPDELHCAKIPIIGFTTCQNAYPNDELLPDVTCILEDNKGICMGDSGGPLMNANNIQIGISSWGTGCGRKGNPDVYVRTDQYLDYFKLFIKAAQNARNAAIFYKINYMWVFGFAIIGNFYMLFKYMLF